MDATDLKNLLRHYTGSEQVFFHKLNRNVNYTEGVRAFAMNAGGGAYWLLDILATQPEILNGVREHGMCVVMLKVEGDRAVLTVARDYHANEDANGKDLGGTFEATVYVRLIEFTDCPAGIWKFYFVGNVIMLPSEY